jgi:hypothetical protein
MHHTFCRCRKHTPETFRKCYKPLTVSESTVLEVTVSEVTATNLSLLIYQYVGGLDVSVQLPVMVQVR